jgi:hypothetical protein
MPTCALEYGLGILEAREGTILGERQVLKTSPIVHDQKIYSIVADIKT